MSKRKKVKGYPGVGAEKPSEIPTVGWWQITRRAWKESKRDQVPLLAAGVAFYSFLALFPAMIAAVTVYGLVADPATVARQSEELTEALPADAASLLTGQMEAVTESPSQTLGLGLVVALVLALWSASGGVGNLMSAVNVAYDEEETRGFVRRKALSLVLTLGAIVFVVLSIGLVAVAPALLDNLVGAGPVRWSPWASSTAWPRTGNRRRFAGCPSARSLRRSCGWWPASASRCTSTTSAATARRTGLWPASSYSSCGSG